MKYLSLFIFLLLLVSCSERETMRQLKAADGIMESRPDSALTMLMEISPESLKGKKENTYHALLLSQAMVKNHYVLTDDSLISIASDYYSDHGSDFDRMRAAFYAGKVKHYQGDYANSLLDAMKAHELAVKLNNTLWRARTSELQLDNYFMTHHYEDAIKTSEEVIKYYKEAGRYDNYYFAMVDYGNTFEAFGDFKRAIKILNEILDGTVRDSAYYSSLEDYAHTYLAFAYLHDGQYKAADSIASIMLKKRNLNDLVSEQLALISQVKFYNDDYSGALDFLEKASKNAITIEDSIIYLDLWKDFALKEKDYEKAYKFQNEVLLLNYKGIEKLLKESPIILQRDFFNHKAQKEKEGKTRITWILSGILFLIFIISIFVYNYSRVKNRLRKIEIEDFISEIDTLKHSLDETGKELSSREYLLNSLRTNLKDKEEDFQKMQLEVIERQRENLDKEKELNELRTNLFREQFSALNKLFEEYSFRYDDKVSEKQIIQNLNKELQSYKSKKKLREIEEAVNRNLNNIAEKLRVDFTSFRPEELTLLILIFAGLSSRSICMILDLNLKTFYTKRSRLSSKIKDSDSPHKQEYLKFL